jgi:ubiquinone/menaquinone biosynthesis C-methylase UbiE
MSKKHKEAVQRQFTKTAEAFAKLAVRDTPEVVAERVQFARPQSTDLALDVACGSGAFVLTLAPRVRFAYGLDLTAEMLRQARAFQQEWQVSNAAFAQGEAEQLPYPAAAFDFVACQFSLHHMLRPELTLQELVRVMKPEGRMLVADSLGPESDEKFELHNRIENLRDASHVLSLRFTTFLKLFSEFRLDILHQSIKRRQRSFNHWMRRAGLEPRHKRYQQARRLLEESLPGDRAGFLAQPQGDDIVISHYEGMFLLARQAVGGRS